MASRFCLIIVLLLMSASLSLAEVYEWTDGQGGLHFTDDLSSIPAQFRKKMKTRDSSAENPPAPQPQQIPQTIEPQPSSRIQRRGQEGFCGQSGAAWQGRFAAIRTEIKQLEESLPGLQEDLQLKHTKLERSLGTLKSDKELRVKKEKELEAEDWKMPPKRIFGSPTQNRQEYQETYNKIKETEQRIQDLQKKLVNLETEAGRCGVPLHLRK